MMAMKKGKRKQETRCNLGELDEKKQDRVTREIKRQSGKLGAQRCHESKLGK